MRPLCVRSHVAVMRAALSEGIICRYKVSTVKTNVSGRTTPPMEPRTWRSLQRGAPHTALHSHPSRTPSSDCLLAANANTARGPPSRSRQPVPGPARTCRKLPGGPFLLPGGSPKPYDSTSAAPGPAEKLPSPRGATRRKRLPAAARGFGKAPSHPARPDPRPEGSSPWGRALEPPRSPRAVWKK